MYSQKYIKYKNKYLALRNVVAISGGVDAYKQYGGPYKWTDIIKSLKRFHNRVKKYYIEKYSRNKDVILDIGSGRGSDARFWIEFGVKFAVGVEPSTDSIKQAIIMYNKLKNEAGSKQITKIVYLNGAGQKNFDDGSAALRDQDRERFKDIFGRKKLKADNINLFWTIHYMMDTEKDFSTLMNNIGNHIKKDGTVVVLCMDGGRIDKLLKEGEGVYEVKKDDKLVFRLKAQYDYEKDKLDFFGNKISVELASTYGLEKGIEENLVFVDELIKRFEDKKFKLIERTEFLDVDIPERKDLKDYEEKVSYLYLALVFKNNLLGKDI